MTELKLETIEKQSKGRNGWFTPAQVDITDTPSGINLAVWSKRKTGEPPIDLYLSPLDVVQLGTALTGGKADELVNRIANLTKDRECHECKADGDEPNLACEGHEAFDMESDDAVDTVHSLISEARDIQRGQSLIVGSNEAFNARLRTLLEIKCPWLLDADAAADGGDAVDTFIEMYVEAGGVVAAEVTA